MALTPEEIDALPSYTPSQMVKLWEYVIAQVGSEGPEVQMPGPDGGTYTLRNLDEARRQLDYWRQREATEAANAVGDTFEYAEL